MASLAKPEGFGLPSLGSPVEQCPLARRGHPKAVHPQPHDFALPSVTISAHGRALTPRGNPSRLGPCVRTGRTLEFPEGLALPCSNYRTGEATRLPLHSPWYVYERKAVLFIIKCFKVFHEVLLLGYPWANSAQTLGGWVNTPEVSFFWWTRGFFVKTCHFCQLLQNMKTSFFVHNSFIIQFIIQNWFYERVDRFMNTFYEEKHRHTKLARFSIFSVHSRSFPCPLSLLVLVALHLSAGAYQVLAKGHRGLGAAPNPGFGMGLGRPL